MIQAVPMSRFASLAALLVVVALTGCNAVQRLSEVGTEPRISAIADPKEDPKAQPRSWPAPAPQPAEDNPASLWRPGAKAFFKDIRAKDVGDIVTVKLRLDNRATLDNSTTRQRDDKEQAKLNTLIGAEGALTDLLPDSVNRNLIDFQTKSQTLGDGAIDRTDKVELEVAAVVTDVMPNGALVIVGRQELRVNYELREMLVRGIVRPQDIEADNTIPHDRIAEMRLAYGGRGTLSDLQQPRWGTQIWDIVAPF
jgi:flagellar L-ring protein FlgH